MLNRTVRQLSICTLLAAAMLLTIQLPQAAADMSSRPGWVVVPTRHTYEVLTNRVQEAAGNQNIGVVAAASATVGIKKLLEKDVPGNVVIGLYHPRFAIRMLEASVAAGIEAPIRVYITQNSDGTATLSYKTPSHVFAPYMDEGGDKLKELADELDLLFATLAKEAAG